MGSAVSGIIGAATGGGKGGGGGDPISAVMQLVSKLAEGLTGGGAA